MSFKSIFERIEDLTIEDILSDSFALEIKNEEISNSVIRLYSKKISEFRNLSVTTVLKYIMVFATLLCARVYAGLFYRRIYYLHRRCLLRNSLCLRYGLRLRHYLRLRCRRGWLYRCLRYGFVLLFSRPYGGGSVGDCCGFPTGETKLFSAAVN